MAPVASHIASGVELKMLGEPLFELEPSLIPPVCHSNRNELNGVTCVADRFGNLLTNIRRRDISAGDRFESIAQWKVHLRRPDVEGWWEVRLVQTYGDAKAGEIVALFGSADRLEISVPNGNARELLGGVAFPLRVLKSDSRSAFAGFSR